MEIQYCVIGSNAALHGTRWLLKQMGSWHVEFEQPRTANEEPKLIYKKYAGPPRQNLPFGLPKWNVFPIWSEHYPTALEAVEVFSLGRTMWMLLEEEEQKDVEDLDVVVVSWSEGSKDVPSICKDIVLRCLDPDPIKRIKLQDLVEFWNGMWEGDSTLSEELMDIST